MIGVLLLGTLLGFSFAVPVPLKEEVTFNRQIGETQDFYITSRNNSLGQEERVCVIDKVVYREGEDVPTTSNCERCTCRPPGFACTFQSCDYHAGCKAIKRADECCPTYQCDCEHNGTIIRNGDRITDENNPCKICYCQGGDIMCTVIQCFTRKDCEGKYEDGKCCPTFNHCSYLQGSLVEISAGDLPPRNRPQVTASTIKAIPSSTATTTASSTYQSPSTQLFTGTTPVEIVSLLSGVTTEPPKVLPKETKSPEVSTTEGEEQEGELIDATTLKPKEVTETEEHNDEHTTLAEEQIDIQTTTQASEEKVEVKIQKLEVTTEREVEPVSEQAEETEIEVGSVEERTSPQPTTTADEELDNTIPDEVTAPPAKHAADESNESKTPEETVDETSTTELPEVDSLTTIEEKQPEKPPKKPVVHVPVDVSPLAVQNDASEDDFLQGVLVQEDDSEVYAINEKPEEKQTTTVATQDINNEVTTTAPEESESEVHTTETEQESHTTDSEENEVHTTVSKETETIVTTTVSKEPEVGIRTAVSEETEDAVSTTVATEIEAESPTTVSKEDAEEEIESTTLVDELQEENAQTTIIEETENKVSSPVTEETPSSTSPSSIPPSSKVPAAAPSIQYDQPDVDVNLYAVNLDTEHEIATSVETVTTTEREVTTIEDLQDEVTTVASEHHENKKTEEEAGKDIETEDEETEKGKETEDKTAEEGNETEKHKDTEDNEMKDHIEDESDVLETTVHEETTTPAKEEADTNEDSLSDESEDHSKVTTEAAEEVTTLLTTLSYEPSTVSETYITTEEDEEVESEEAHPLVPNDKDDVENDSSQKDGNENIHVQPAEELINEPVIQDQPETPGSQNLVNHSPVDIEKQEHVDGKTEKDPAHIPNKLQENLQEDSEPLLTVEEADPLISENPEKESDDPVEHREALNDPVVDDQAFDVKPHPDKDIASLQDDPVQSDPLVGTIVENPPVNIIDSPVEVKPLAVEAEADVEEKELAKEPTNVQEDSQNTLANQEPDHIEIHEAEEEIKPLGVQDEIQQIDIEPPQEEKVKPLVVIASQDPEDLPPVGSGLHVQEILHDDSQQGQENTQVVQVNAKPLEEEVPVQDPVEVVEASEPKVPTKYTAEDPVAESKPSDAAVLPQLDESVPEADPVGDVNLKTVESENPDNVVKTTSNKQSLGEVHDSNVEEVEGLPILPETIVFSGIDLNTNQHTNTKREGSPESVDIFPENTFQTEDKYPEGFNIETKEENKPISDEQEKPVDEKQSTNENVPEDIGEIANDPVEEKPLEIPVIPEKVAEDAIEAVPAKENVPVKPLELEVHPEKTAEDAIEIVPSKEVAEEKPFEIPVNPVKPAKDAIETVSLEEADEVKPVEVQVNSEKVEDAIEVVPSKGAAVEKPFEIPVNPQKPAEDAIETVSLEEPAEVKPVEVQVNPEKVAEDAIETVPSKETAEEKPSEIPVNPENLAEDAIEIVPSKEAVEETPFEIPVNPDKAAEDAIEPVPSKDAAEQKPLEVPVNPEKAAEDAIETVPSKETAEEKPSEIPVNHENLAEDAIEIVPSKEAVEETPFEIPVNSDKAAEDAIEPVPSKDAAEQKPLEVPVNPEKAAEDAIEAVPSNEAVDEKPAEAQSDEVKENAKPIIEAIEESANPAKDEIVGESISKYETVSDPLKEESSEGKVVDEQQVSEDEPIVGVHLEESSVLINAEKSEDQSVEEPKKEPVVVVKETLPSKESVAEVHNDEAPPNKEQLKPESILELDHENEKPSVASDDSPKNVVEDVEPQHSESLEDVAENIDHPKNIHKVLEKKPETEGESQEDPIITEVEQKSEEGGESQNEESNEIPLLDEVGEPDLEVQDEVSQVVHLKAEEAPLKEHDNVNEDVPLEKIHDEENPVQHVEKVSSHESEQQDNLEDKPEELEPHLQEIPENQLLELQHETEKDTDKNLAPQIVPVKQKVGVIVLPKLPVAIEEGLPQYDPPAENREGPNLDPIATRRRKRQIRFSARDRRALEILR